MNSNSNYPSLNSLHSVFALHCNIKIVLRAYKYHQYLKSSFMSYFLGTSLRNLSLDSFSVTEVLRLHLLSSGCRQRVSWQGVATPSEDPGLFFKMEEPELLKKLEETSVFELNCGK